MPSTATSTRTIARSDQIVPWLIAGSSTAFIMILVVAAVFDASIRVLHVLEAFIYVAVIVLARQRSAWGYGAGLVSRRFGIGQTLFTRHSSRQV